MKTFLTPNPLDSAQVVFYGDAPPSDPWVGMLWVDYRRPEVIKVWNGGNWVPVRSSSGVSCKFLKKSSLGNSAYTMDPDDTVLVIDFDVFDGGPNVSQAVYLPHSSNFPSTSDRRKVVVVAKSRTSRPMSFIAVMPSSGDTIDGSMNPVNISALGGSVTFILDGTNWVSYQRNDFVTGYYYQFQQPTYQYDRFNTLHPINCIDTPTQFVGSHRVYYIPTILNRSCTITYLGIEIVMTRPGNFYIGIYTNGSNDMPNRLIYSVGPLFSGVAGIIGTELSTPLRLFAGELFWVAVVFTDSPSIRMCPGVSLFPFLGVTNNGVFYTHMFGFSTTLPNPANAISYGTGNIPLIYARFSYL